MRADGLSADTHDQAVSVACDRLHLRSEHEPGPRALQALRQGLRQLAVQERQQPGPTVHQRDLHAEGGEDRGVLGANRAASHDHQAFRQPLDREHGLGIVNVGVIEGDVRGVEGTGTGCQQDDTGPKDPLPALVVSNDHRPIRSQPCLTVNQLDAVPFQVLKNGRCHGRHHVGRAGPQSIHHQVGCKADANPVHVAA